MILYYVLTAGNERSTLLEVYNTMSRSKEAFRPRVAGKVSIFTCGPSTYRRPHIGNYRTFLYEDILVRYLLYQDYDVHRVINFTDVEDKAIVEAESKGKKVSEITSDVAKHFFHETGQLGIKLPDHIPASSTSVDQAVEIIKKLVEEKHAYWYDGDVFFDPLTFKEFGKLFRLDMSTWPKHKVRFKKDTYNGRRWNRGDFILWHGHNNELPESAYWDSEIGRGRPAWNIQDPAMILQQIGTQVDINCGGIDNIYRHHDYNIAVMESFSGKTYANYYLHGEHLIIDGKTMSKSLGNILYPDDLFKKGFEPSDLRYFLIHEHYRKKLNFTTRAFEKTCRKLDAFRKVAKKLTEPAKENAAESQAISELLDSICPTFETHMNDDLSVGAGFDAVHQILERIDAAAGGTGLSSRLSDSLLSSLRKIDTVCGVIKL